MFDLNTQCRTSTLTDWNGISSSAMARKYWSCSRRTIHGPTEFHNGERRQLSVKLRQWRISSTVGDRVQLLAANTRPTFFRISCKVGSERNDDIITTWTWLNEWGLAKTSFRSVTKSRHNCTADDDLLNASVTKMYEQKVAQKEKEKKKVAQCWKSFAQSVALKWNSVSHDISPLRANNEKLDHM